MPSVPESQMRRKRIMKEGEYGEGEKNKGKEKKKYT
jgi:hypothetical protein